MNGLVRIHRSDSGTTLVEFALVAPVLILILVCCLDFARALNAYVLVTNATRDGARYATVHTDPVAVKAYVARRMSPLAVDPSRDIFVTATPTSDERWIATAPRPWSVIVEVRYRWAAVTWVAGSFFSASGSRTFDVTSTMEAMR